MMSICELAIMVWSARLLTVRFFMKRKVEEDRRPKRVFEGLEEFVRNRVSQLRELMQVDVARAKVELEKVRESRQSGHPNQIGRNLE
jgi:hypothetical protein